MDAPTYPDLLGRTAALVDVPSVSRDEGRITAVIESELRAVPWLELTRVGMNLVARTDLGRDRRVILAGHTDTVPPDGNDRARRSADRVAGVGSADMKGGLAVMLEAALGFAEPAVDVTYVFYAREEIAAAESGLAELLAERPDLVDDGDVAILGEPTDGWVEAGCQGTLRLRVVLRGVRAHTARPWMGRNAIHRLAPVLESMAGFEERRPVLDGCEYREALQVVRVEGGVAGNVVPDRAELLVNHRFAPDRTAVEAEAAVRALLAPHLEPDDEVVLDDLAPGAAPGLTHPVLSGLIARNDLSVRAKLGWTDVARFAERGIPAVNLGPGDATLAHTPDEEVTADQLRRVWIVVRDLLVGGG